MDSSGMVIAALMLLTPPYVIIAFAIGLLSARASLSADHRFLRHKAR
jgi:hypothetical protein